MSKQGFCRPQLAIPGSGICLQKVPTLFANCPHSKSHPVSYACACNAWTVTVVTRISTSTGGTRRLVEDGNRGGHIDGKPGVQGDGLRKNAAASYHTSRYFFLLFMVSCSISEPTGLGLELFG
ncbi:hypothetical protein PAXRUDRAFT_750149 [Paxillus rubicundulus Ve08.2h10]|uniref:Unplaced genomic scaffold scaffold_949, whole genome shotgun sequence n=1 Tax=Paxillus rubicundulus Ve08.2h10 TaxID=930991 RepID=A0A0D0D0Q0_9AGAM|nr:hypothetical protein PAXRUDRAFT_750149 [Paxillus rubicundulus Ve08.2h10]